MPKLQTGEMQIQVPQLLGYLLAEFASDPVPVLPTEVSNTAPLPVRTVFDDRMMVYTFSCLDKETCLEDPDKCYQLLRRATVINFDDLDRNGAADDPYRDLIRGRYQGFSKEGTCLVVFNSDKFHERFFGIYHGTYYFDIFLLATLQRVTLLSLYERLSNISGLTGGWRHQHLLRRVRRDLLLFKNQCCFSQITNRERGLALWRRWQEVFENSTVLGEVNEQSAELDNYLRNRMREKVETLLRLGGFLAAALPIVLGLDVLMPADRWGPWVGNLRWILFLGLILGGGIYASFVFFRRAD